MKATTMATTSSINLKDQQAVYEALRDLGHGMAQSVQLSANVVRNPQLYRCTACKAIAIVEGHKEDCPEMRTLNIKGLSS